MPGTGKLVLTGQLGDVMKESAQAAVSFLRSRSSELGLPDDYFAKHDMHIHVPAGATPKDGPSAGIALATSIASMLTGLKVDPNLAMTGEITLTGQVLPIGGLKEKVLGAKRAGIRKILVAEAQRDRSRRHSQGSARHDDVRAGRGALRRFCITRSASAIISPVPLGGEGKTSNVVPMRRNGAVRRRTERKSRVKR